MGNYKAFRFIHRLRLQNLTYSTCTETGTDGNRINPGGNAPKTHKYLPAGIYPDHDQRSVWYLGDKRIESNENRDEGPPEIDLQGSSGLPRISSIDFFQAVSEADESMWNLILSGATIRDTTFMLSLPKSGNSSGLSCGFRCLLSRI